MKKKNDNILQRFHFYKIKLQLLVFFVLLLFSLPVKATSQQIKAIIAEDYPPYSFINDKGEPDGFSIDLVKAVANEMDLEIDLKGGEWDTAMTNLEKGSIDLIPLMAYNAERGRRYYFSVAYIEVYDTFFFKKGTLGIRNLEDLSGKKVIVQKSDLAHDFLISSGLFKTMTIVLANSVEDTLEQLAAGKGDLAILPKLIGLISINKLNLVNIETSPHLILAYTRHWSFAVKHGNTILLEKLNQGLNIIKTNGEYDRIYKKWFGIVEAYRLESELVYKYIKVTAAIFTIFALFFLWIFWRRCTKNCKNAAKMQQD